MSNNILRVTNLNKQYKDFALRDISFDVPTGSIVGLIGENGAGKSTILNATLGLIQKDSGQIIFFDQNSINDVNKNEIGVVFDGHNYPDTLSPQQLNNVFKNIYKTWDEQEYNRLMKQFLLPINKQLKHYSKGMKMKFSIAVALSHHSKFLILDEATSGLDPIIRDEILDLFLEFMQDEEHSILVSSHITTDLEKVADYIIFIHQGHIIFAKSKDELLEQYGLIKCNEKQFKELHSDDIITYRKQDYEYQILTSDRKKVHQKYPNLMILPATIDEIMLMYIKGVK